MPTRLQDLRHAVRRLRESPGFTAIAVLTLALGSGANTAIFSLLDEAALQRLPVDHPGQLRTAVVVSRTSQEMSNVPAEFFQELRAAPRALSGVAGYWRAEMNFDTGGDTERVLVQYVSGGYYSTLGVPMFLGRPIANADEDSRDRVAILSHRFWKRRFGGEASALGSAINLDGLAATVVGVTPPDFFGMDRGVSPDVTVPLPNPAPFSNLWVTVRLNAAASDVEAQTEAEAALQRALQVIRPRLSRYRDSERDWFLTLHAGLRPGDKGQGAAMQSYLEPLRLLILLSLVVLLIACLNVANLLLARALARTHEFGVRLALGASRARLMGQVLTESLVLAALGSLAGVALGFFLHRALLQLLMGDLAHRALGFSMNAHLFGFSLATAALTVLFFGVVPAVRATQIDLGASLKGAAQPGRGRRQLLARGLVAVEVAAALILLLGAGLLLRSFRNLGALDTGVQEDRMLTMRIALGARETQRRYTARVYSDLASRVEAIPGVVSAALGWDFALGSGRAGKSIWVEGQPPERSQSAGFNVVGPRFFATAGVPVVLGREFTLSDAAGARKVVVVNEAWVRRYAAGRNPIGMRVGDEGAASIGKYEVIGVVRDSLTMNLRRETGPMLYQPLLQDEWASSVVLHVRTRDNPWLLEERVRAEIRAVNPRLPVYDVTTLSDRRSLSLRRDRTMAILAGGLGAVAVLLTMVGVYGVIACSVGRRTAEIGIRMALGATAASVRGLILREILSLVAIGGLVGIPLALAAAKLLKSMLFGVASQDPLTLLASLSVLILAGLLAGFVPARRAARLEPAAALRRN